MMAGDVVGIWEVALSDGVYRIEFEHGTATGKRVVWINGQEVLRRDWMFKLVGKETFTVGGMETKATVNIEAISGFTYEYTLEIDGKSLQKFIDNRSKVTKTWVLQGEFVDDGTETHFTVADHDCCIKALSSGKKRAGIIHYLMVDGEAVPGWTD
ncbi:fas apoptotic inhibitory molecule 1-like [Salvelinus fontinalis]|uniref:fas apoptotic inhibitory molecule 1-like n=1 Tax=Salvelinus fontinalis TaxID=8038 RepID=UPI0024862852|nr:fas apoptotic inhibitory molecule 1-like [Salvelinus fontinalis]